ncbi:hypothetical protein Slin14017_G129090 [Septoria linicola]|nr:hypothetical protein Slin14017_G129090 [Septoria linicola]
MATTKSHESTIAPNNNDDTEAQEKPIHTIVASATTASRLTIVAATSAGPFLPSQTPPCTRQTYMHYWQIIELQNYLTLYK